MGSRRVSRKRLYNVEKAGITIDIEPSVGMKNFIKSASQHRQGQEIITEILIDIGAAGGTMLHGAGAGKACGEAGLAAITKMTVAKYGVVTEVRCVVLEATAEDLDVVASSDHERTRAGTAPSGGLVSVIAGGGSALAKGQDNAGDIDDATVRSLYIVDGTGGLSSITAQGKLAIYIHGFEVPADL